MKKIIKLTSTVFVGLFLLLSLTSCNNDDDSIETVYDFSTESYTDLTIANNTDDATKMQNLFLDKKWFTTKTFSGNTVEENDAQAKAFFDEVVAQANNTFAEMTFNGNCKFTYKCTRSNTSTDAEMEIAKQEWSYLGRETTESTPTSKMVLTTSKAVGETIEIAISAYEDDQSNIWIDLNNDGTYDKATESVKKFNTSEPYTLASATVTIYGKVVLLQVENQKINALEVADNSSLEILKCNNNDLENLDISKNTKLRSLICHTNKLTALNTDSNTALESIVCYKNSITSINVSGNSRLRQLMISGNKLTSINVNENLKLERFSCRMNAIDNLDVTKNTALIHLDCSSNNISELNIANNTKLLELYCDNNTISALDVSKQPLLQRIWMAYNSVETLDLSANAELQQLICNHNKLQQLDLSNNKKLTRVWAQENADLKCIKIAEGINTSDDNNWRKNTDAKFSTTCE